MSEQTTPRDKVWTTIIKLDHAEFTVGDIRDNLAEDRSNLAYGSSTATSSVSDETIRRVLRAGVDLGVIDHEPGSKFYRKEMRISLDVNWQITQS